VVKERSIRLPTRINQTISYRVRAWAGVGVAIALRAMQAIALGSNLLERGPKELRVLAGIDGQRSRIIWLKIPDVKLAHPPGKQPLFSKLWKLSGIACQPIGFSCQNPGSLMMSMTIFGVPLPHRNDYIGTKTANRPDHIAQNQSAVPLPQCFLRTP